MEEEVKKKSKKKKKENNIETQCTTDNKEVDVSVEENSVDELSNIIEEVMTEEIKEVVEEETKNEVERHIASCFTTEEKLYITRLIANGYRPFDIVKKVRFNLKLSEEKLQRLSLNVRTVEQLVRALED